MKVIFSLFLSVAGFVGALVLWAILRLVINTIKYKLRKKEYVAFPSYGKAFSIPETVADPSGFVSRFWKAYEAARQPGKPAPMFMHMGTYYDGSHLLCALHPDVMRDVATNDKFYPKAYMYRQMLDSLIGEGLVTLEGPEWSFHRKLLTPLFHFNVLKTYMPVMAEYAAKFSDELLALRGEPVMPTERLGELTMDIICQIAFGGSLAPRSIKRYFKEAEKWFQKWYVMGVLLLGPALWRKLFFLPPVFMVERAKSKIKEMIVEVIEQRRRGENLGRGDKDVIGLLMAAQADANTEGRISDENIANESVTFLFGGHETSAAALSWALYFLSQRPDCQERLAEEMVAAWPVGEPFNEESVLENAYLKAVINETMRLRPTTVAWLSRQASADIEISGQVIPKGTVIGVSFQMLHTHPDLWERAEEFVPERWLEAKPHAPFAFLPFSVGPRNCIGQKFAVQEMQIVLAEIVRRTRFELAEDPAHPIERKMIGAQVPANLRLRFHSRQG